MKHPRVYYTTIADVEIMSEARDGGRSLFFQRNPLVKLQGHELAMDRCIVTSSATSRFEEAENFCYTYFNFIKDTKCPWNNLGDKTMSFTVKVYSFKD